MSDTALYVATSFLFFSLSFSGAADDFKQIVRTAMTSRPPPYAAVKAGESCHVVLLSSSESLIREILSLPLPNHEQTTEIYTTRDLMAKSKQCFKHSPMCVTIVIEAKIAFEVQQNRRWVDHFIMNMKQLGVHFLLVGLKTQILSFLNTDAYDMLKYKTALTTDTQEVIVGDTGVYRPVDLIPPLPSENQLVNGRSMKLSTWKLEPYATFDIAGNPVGGFGYKQMVEFCQHYNVTCVKVVEISALKFPNGSWAGHMKAVVEGDTDAVAPIGLLRDRYGPADFTTPAVPWEGVFITSHPRASVKWQALLYPFDLTVWLAILGVMVTLIPIYYLHFRYSHSYRPLEIAQAMYGSVATPFALLTQECVPIPRHAKLLTVFFVFFSLLTSNYYNSNLISFLTFPEIDTLPTTLEELVAARHKFHLALLTVPGNVFHTYLTQSTNPEAVKIREVIDFNLDHSACIRRAATEYDYICLMSVVYANSVGTKNLTLHSTFKPFVQSKHSLATVMMPVATAWNSRYYSVLNRNTVRLHDTGHFDKWTQDATRHVYVNSRPWMREQVAKNTPLVQALTRAMEDADHSSLKPFKLKNFVLCFGALVTGLTLSLVTWLGECSTRCGNLCRTKRVVKGYHITDDSMNVTLVQVTKPKTAVSVCRTAVR